MVSSSLARRTVPVIALVMLGGLVAGACGARLTPALRQTAANAVLNPGSGAAVANGGGGGGGASAAGGSAPTGQAAGQGQPVTGGSGSSGVAQPGGVSGATGHHPTTSSTSPTSAAGGTNPASCPAPGTGVGLTNTSVHVGTVASLSGPVPGLFTGAVQGIESFANMVNHTGGLCGRTLNVDAADDGTNCSQDENATQDLVDKDFAMVGTFALYDGCGALILKQHPTVPDVHVGLDPSAVALPNHFDLAAGKRGYATGMFAYWRHKYGTKVQHVGTIAENIPSALANQQNMVHAAQSQGWKFTYTRNASPVETSFMNDFVKMCHSGVQIFFTVTETAQNAATMMENERAAGCKGLINIIPIAYDQSFIPDYQGSPSELNGIQGWSEYSLFFNRDEAARIPELKTLQSWFNRTYPGQPLNLYGMYAWADGRLFQQGFTAAAKATRPSVLAALHRIKSYSDHGVIAPIDPGSRSTGIHCYILWQLHDGVFSRMDDPASGYRCDGKFLPLS